MSEKPDVVKPWDVEMDMIITAAIALALAVTILCATLQRGAEEDNNNEYDQYLDEEDDHRYYDRTTIRYRNGEFDR